MRHIAALDLSPGREFLLATAVDERHGWQLTAFKSQRIRTRNPISEAALNSATLKADLSRILDEAGFRPDGGTIVCGTVSGILDEKWLDVLQSVAPSAKHSCVPAISGCVASLKNMGALKMENTLLICGNSLRTHFGLVNHDTLLPFQYAGAGADHIANDVSLGLGMPMVEAEGIVSQLLPADIMASEGSTVSRTPASITYLRLKEIAESVQRTLTYKKIDIRTIRSGFLCGELSQCPGAPEVLNRVLGLPIMQAPSLCFEGLSIEPAHFTVFGLLRGVPGFTGCGTA